MPVVHHDSGNQSICISLYIHVIGVRKCADHTSNPLYEEIRFVLIIHIVRNGTVHVGV
jgi:hypothetical protein